MSSNENQHEMLVEGRVEDIQGDRAVQPVKQLGDLIKFVLHNRWSCRSSRGYSPSSQHEAQLHSETVHMGFMVENWHWDKYLSVYFSFLLSILFPPVLNIHSSVIREMVIGAIMP
jgi:hypothetical protein